MANISVTNTFSNSTTADATQVNQNFSDIINGTSDGTKDFSISALTVGGTLTAHGNVTLGNASSDDLSITASLASSLAIKTTATYNVGSSTLGLLSVYLGNSTFTTRLLSGASASWSMTLPATAGTSRYRLETDGAGATSWVKSFTSASDIRNASLAVSLSGNAMTVALKGADGNDPSTTNPVTIVFRSATATTGSLSEVVVTSALSVTVSSGSTLGTTSAVESKINVYAINNAGTVELAVANLGATSTDGRLSTTAEGGAGAADSATVFYSTTARSNVAYKLLGAVVSTQTTAGTWAQAITSIITVGCGMVFGYAYQDTTSYTPTGNWSSNITWTGMRSRSGDIAHFRTKAVVSASGSSGNFIINFPSGIAPDTSKLPSVDSNQILGKAVVNDNASGTYHGVVLYNGSGSVYVRYLKNFSGTQYYTTVSETDPFITLAASDSVYAEFSIPVIGWFARDWQVG